MINIRHGIYETNSSTTHCLIVSTNSVTQNIIEEFKKKNGTHIVFGLRPYSEVSQEVLWETVKINENTPFQTKADLLYFSMYIWSDENTTSYLHKKNILSKKLKELGFTVEFREDTEVIEDDYSRSYDVGENMFDYMWGNISEVINYLFGTHVLWYSWCDECCPDEPVELSEAINRFAEYEKQGNEKFEVHHYR